MEVPQMIPGGLWHIETFESKVEPGVLEAFFKDELLPYMRSRGFVVKVFATQYSLGPAQFWLLTELSTMGSFDEWPEMAEGEPHGRALMDRLAGMMGGVRGSVVRDLEMPGHGR
jgi:hypothetical protein